MGAGWTGERGMESRTREEEVLVWDCDPECPVAALDEQAGHLVSGKPTGTKRGDRRDEDTYGDMNVRFGGVPVTGYGDAGGASRFFKVVRG